MGAQDHLLLAKGFYNHPLLSEPWNIFDPNLAASDATLGYEDRSAARIGHMD